MEQADLQSMNFSPLPIVDADGSVTLYLYGGVTVETISRLISEIHQYGNANNVQLRIKTNGGDMDEAFTLWDVIREYGINTHLDGFGFSAGLFIFLAGTRRTMHRNAKFMWHELKYQNPGTLTQQEAMCAEMRKRQDSIDELIISQSGITKEQLNWHYDRSSDWFINFEEALELGMLTDVMVIHEDTYTDLDDGLDKVARVVEYITVEEYDALLKEESAKTDKA